MSLTKTLAQKRCWLACAFLLTCVALLSEAAGQKNQAPIPQPARNLKAEIARLESEIERLRQSAEAPPAWKEMLKTEAELEALRAAHGKVEGPLQVKLSKLSATDEVQEWDERIAAHSRRLWELQTEDRKLVLDEARQQFPIRHAELARLGPTKTPHLAALGFDVLTYPSVNGSTSTQPLATLIACRCFGLKSAWVGREQARPDRYYDPSKPHNELRDRLHLQAYYADMDYTLLEFTLRAQVDRQGDDRLRLIINGLLVGNTSTETAYGELIGGSCDLGLLARRPSTSEIARAKEQGVVYEAVPCALDAFVFLVHRDNPVRNLSRQQIRDIYSGKVQSWQSIGGRQARLSAYQREEGSGSQELMRSLVMREVPLATTADGMRPPQLLRTGMAGPFHAITSDEHGIGYSVYYYERYMSGSPRTRVIAVDGVEPSAETIASRKYPFVSEVFVVTRADLPPTAPVRRLRDWLLSAEGQAVVRESGYVPLARER